jgi:tripartite ATP-independent transporter DctP family solute receptor
MRTVVAGLLAAGFAFAMPAQAEIWRLSTDIQLESPEGKGYQKFAELVDKYTKGALKIQIFPGSQLGKEDAVLEQLSAGVVQLFPDAMSAAQKWVPEISYVGAPFAFADRDHWRRFIKTDLVQGWLKQVHDKAGIDVIGDPTAFLRGPYRVMVSKRPVAGLDDIKGLKLRLAKDQLTVDVWRYLGADVRILDFSEVYDALDRNMIEALNSPIALVESTRAYEVAKNVIRTDEYWQSVAWFVNARAYEGLSQANKDAVNRAFQESSELVQQLTTDYTKESIERMKKTKVVFAEMNIKPVVDKMAAFYADREKAGTLPRGFMEALNKSR